MQHQSGGSSNSWISLPYSYFPNGNVGQPVQNSLDACADMNGAPINASRVNKIIRYNTATDAPVTQSCAGKTKAFDLVPGDGYSVKPARAGISIGMSVC